MKLSSGEIAVLGMEKTLCWCWNILSIARRTYTVAQDYSIVRENLNTRLIISKDWLKISFVFCRPELLSKNGAWLVYFE
jgi:hypothetical protein